MALHIIIDGYNLIRQSDHLSVMERQDMQLGRETLIDMLAVYKRVKSHKITVVFDAAEAHGISARKEQIRGIAVRFSKPGEIADAVIKRMADKEKQRGLIVSSDNEVVRFAMNKGCAAIGSREFEQKIAAAAYGLGLDDEESAPSGWVPTTKKKGPARRKAKRKRRNKAKIAKL